jgi:hypothetical protein
MAKFTFNLTRKNALSGIAAVVVLGLTIIPLTVRADHLSWHRWQVLIGVLAVVALVSICWQISIQSREDDERATRDRAIEKLLISNTPTTQLQVDTPATEGIQDTIYVELRSTFLYPKMGDLTFGLQEQKILASGGTPADARADCDLLVELYIVNRGTTEAYIKDFEAWIETYGEWEKLKLDDNFDLDDLWSGSVEYGLETHARKNNFPLEPVELPKLVSYRNKAMKPQQPIEGWLKFTVRNANPRLEYSIRVAAIDTLDKAHYMDKRNPIPREIALRKKTS